jgi:hypothetical protein
MARSGMSEEIDLPGPSRQLAFHELLAGARKTVLRDALRGAVTALDPEAISDELGEYAPRAARAILAKAGIRDEEVFPVPLVLREAPTLVGYYRLLLGASQKQFYASGNGTGPLKAMEDRGSISAKAEAILHPFCQSMCAALAELIEQLSPAVTPRDIEELPLLTLGSQFQGSNNNKIGQVATEKVFLAIKEIVSDHVKQDGRQEIVVENSAGRGVKIVLAADPDVRIEEEFDDGHHRPLVAMEIKGGTDRSNAHNRAGEAEKSHQKAKGLGFRDCWTIIAKGGLDLAVLESESPTTNSWFDAAEILGREGADWNEFRSRLVGSVGIPS